MLGKAIKRTTYSETRAKLKPLLRFSRTRGRLPGLPVLALLYPSPTLARLGDPLEICRTSPHPVTAAQTLKLVKDRVAQRLEPLLSGRPADGPVDETWYWATPFLLDSLEDPEGARAWLGREHLAEVWGGADERGEDFARHIDAARDVTVEGLGRPPDDLAEIVGPNGPGRPGSRGAARSLAGHRRAGRAHRPVGAGRRRENRLGTPQPLQSAGGDRHGAALEGVLEGGPRLLLRRLPSGGPRRVRTRSRRMARAHRSRDERDCDTSRGDDAQHDRAANSHLRVARLRA